MRNVIIGYILFGMISLAVNPKGVYWWIGQLSGLCVLLIVWFFRDYKFQIKIIKRK